MQMSVFPTVPIWVTGKYSLRQLNNIYCKWNSLTIICTLVVLVAPLLQVPSQSPSTGTCEDDTGLPWKQDDKMTRWQDDKMTTQDCPGNKACDPFALKFISYCCSYISIEWLTDSENLLPTLNHTFKSWSRDFSWWRKNYCFLLNLFIHTFPLPNCFSKWFAMFIFVNAVLTVAPVHTVRVFCAFLGRRITCDGGGDDGKHFFETFLFSRGGGENV